MPPPKTRLVADIGPYPRRHPATQAPALPTPHEPVSGPSLRAIARCYAPSATTPTAAPTPPATAKVLAGSACSPPASSGKSHKPSETWSAAALHHRRPVRVRNTTVSQSTAMPDSEETPPALSSAAG